MVGGLTPVGKVPPMLTVVPDLSVSLPADGPSSLIGQIVREGARQMLAAALRAEVAAYTDQFAGVRGEDGRRLVVRNRSAGPRTVLTSAGAVGVTAPRVNDKRTDPESGQRMRFSSAILPPWARKTPRVSEVLPLLYLHGLSSGGLRPGAGPVPGHWRRAVVLDGHEADRDVEGRGRGVHDPGPVAGGLRVPVGGRDPPGHPTGGGQAVPAGDDRRGAGVLEGRTRSVPAGQDAALLVPQDRRRARCAAGVRASGREEGAGRDLERRGQGPRPRRSEGVPCYVRGEVPKAAAKVTGDEEELPAFNDYPAEHWVHLCTTNPIESTFATVRLRAKVTKGHGSKAA